MEEKDIEKQTDVKQEKITVFSRAVEIACLTVTTIVLLVVFITNGLSTGNFGGFANGTAEVSDMFYLQITPAGWTFSIWSIIYTWRQVLWLLYAWSFVFRPSTPRTVSWISLLLYTCADIGNIIWIFVWVTTTLRLPSLSSS